jgi:hypothetical protein
MDGEKVYNGKMDGKNLQLYYHNSQHLRTLLLLSIIHYYHPLLFIIHYSLKGFFRYDP